MLLREKPDVGLNNEQLSREEEEMVFHLLQIDSSRAFNTSYDIQIKEINTTQPYYVTSELYLFILMQLLKCAFGVSHKILCKISKAPRH